MSLDVSELLAALPNDDYSPAVNPEWALERLRQILGGTAPTQIRFGSRSQGIFLFSNVGRYAPIAGAT